MAKPFKSRKQTGQAEIWGTAAVPRKSYNKKTIQMKKCSAFNTKCSMSSFKIHNLLLKSHRKWNLTFADKSAINSSTLLLAVRKGVFYMTEKKIKLTTVADAKAFVDEAGKCDFDIDIFYNRVVIDAKSILGVLSLDMSQVLTVRMYGESQELEAFLQTLSPENEKVVA